MTAICNDFVASARFIFELRHLAPICPYQQARRRRGEEASQGGDLITSTRFKWAKKCVVPDIYMSQPCGNGEEWRKTGVGLFWVMGTSFFSQCYKTFSLLFLPFHSQLSVTNIRHFLCINLTEPVMITTSGRKQATGFIRSLEFSLGRRNGLFRIFTLVSPAVMKTSRRKVESGFLEYGNFVSCLFI